MVTHAKGGLNGDGLIQVLLDQDPVSSRTKDSIHVDHISLTMDLNHCDLKEGLLLRLSTNLVDVALSNG